MNNYTLKRTLDRVELGLRIASVFLALASLMLRLRDWTSDD